jgi:cytochrome subunit of sulfide dehydrogenase
MRTRNVNDQGKKALARSLLGTLALAAAPLALAADIGSCVSCHGENGISENPEIPTISGTSAFYFENQLFLFQDEGRPCVADLFAKVEGAAAADHCALVTDLSEGDIQEIAAHYADQPFQAASQSFDAGQAEAGAAIHDRSCARCHNEGGGDPADDAGILAGQWIPYLQRSMTDFREGRREQPATMEREMQALSDADIEALAAYYASQGQ